MTKFSPILRKPGEIIKSEDWNRMQEDILSDIEELERKLQVLRDYVDNMEESATMLNMDSIVGKSYNLDEVIPGETSSYDAPIVGLLTKQWLPPRGEVGDICRFSVVARLELLDYWSGAENGDKNALKLSLTILTGPVLLLVSSLFMIEESLDRKVVKIRTLNTSSRRMSMCGTGTE